MSDKPPCSHCYCQRVDVNGIPHRKCCNCGNQQAERSPISWGMRTWADAKGWKTI